MPVGLRKNSLLVVDDNHHMQSEIRDLGVAASYDVVTTASYDGAIQAIRRRRFDAAIVDMRLYEPDPDNKQGLAIIAHLSELAEGTIYALLTGYGKYDDAYDAKRYDAGILRKPEFAGDVQRMLTNAASATTGRRLIPARGWCGNEHPDFWSAQANTLLRPKGDYGVTLNLLEELLLTCDPIRERIDSRGLEPIPDQPAMAGLYWSRGIGEPVVVIVGRDAIPSAVPTPPHWPAIAMHDELYRTQRKNLVGAIVRCSGVVPEDFPVKRSYVE